MKDLKPVYIEWEDAAASPSGWTTKIKMIEWGNKSQLMKQVGFILENKKEFIILATVYSERQDSFRAGFKIPKKLIKKMENLNEVV